MRLFDYINYIKMFGSGTQTVWGVHEREWKKGVLKEAVAVLGKNIWGLAPHHLGGNNG